MTSGRRRVGLVGAILSIALLAAGILPDDTALLTATKRGDVAGVKAALKAGANPSAAQGDGLTALHLAAQEGNLEITKVLIGARANLEAKTRIGDYTPLHLAAGAGRLEVVKTLLGAGAKAGAMTSTTGVTPLHLAAKTLNGELIVRALLEKGAPVNARETSYGQTALMFAAGYDRAASVKELLAHGADPSLTTDSRDLLKQILVDKAATARLRQAISDIRKQTPDGTERELTASEEQKAIAAQRAFFSEKDQIAKLLEGFTPDKVGTRRPWWDVDEHQSTDTIMGRPIAETLVGKTGGMSALHHAAREGNIAAAQALLDGGANIDQQSADGSTPLVQALLNGRFEMGLALIERGANPNIATETDGIVPLLALLQTQWTLKYTNQPQPRAQDQDRTGYMEVLDALLAAGANPNVRLKTHLWHFEWEGKMGLDITGATPFWRAAFAQDLDAMKALAAHGADPNIPTAWPEPGMRDSRQEDGRVAEDSGKPILPEGSPNMYPIHATAGGGYLGLGAFQQNNVPNNFMATTRYLVEDLGVDVNQPDAWGYTALHYAAVRGDNAMIEYLVSKGADVKAVTTLGQSVVDMTRGGRNGFFSRVPRPETQELLLRLGSEFKCLNTHMRNNGDWCPGAGVAPFDGALVQDGQLTTTKK